MTVRAAQMTGERMCHELPIDEAIQKIRSREGTIWLDVTASNRDEAFELLHDDLGFHELAVEDSLSSEERPSVQEFDDHIFASVSALLQEAEHERYVDVSFFLTPSALVTVSAEQLSVVDEWFKRWNDHPHRLGGHPASVMHAVMDAVVDAYLPAIDIMRDESEDLADRIFEGDSGQVKNLLMLKRRLISLRRRAVPMRDVLNGLLRRDSEMIPENVRPYFQDVFDHLLRIVELADQNRETLSTLLDVHLNTVNNHLNDIVKRMTVYSLMLMGPTLVAGVYGMNFKYMPELEWYVGYPFSIGLMVLTSFLIWFVFKRKGWISGPEDR